MSLVGQRLAGRYTLAKLLGHGGMGAVYEAVSDAGERVAIKLLDRSLLADEGAVRRFAREARILTELRSPHVVRVHETGTHEGAPFLVMTLLHGRDLGERLRIATRLSVEETLTIGGEILEGLAAAHEAGVVHRDLKPDNVYLADVPDAPGAPPRATLIDFGMSKQERPKSLTTPLALTVKGTVLGTPLYLSPEQARAGDVDARADLYSVGAILFECLTGRPPHTGETHEQILLAICTRDAPDPRAIDPRIPGDLAKLLLRALARERDARFASARAMAAALADVRRNLAAGVGGAPSPKDPGVAGRLGRRPSTPPGGPVAEGPAPPADSAPHRVRAGLFLGLGAAACGALFTLVVALSPRCSREAERAAPPTWTPDEARADAAAP